MIHAFETADIYSDRLSPGFVFAETERRTTAIGTEMVLNDMLVECIGGKLTVGCSELQLLPGQEPEQISLPTAMRAIALDDWTQITFHFVFDRAAMT